MIKLAISGARGKMGERITILAKQDSDLKIVSLLERTGHTDIGIKYAGLGVSDNPENIKAADVLIEFSSPEATIEHLGVCLKYKKAIVIGTTGLSKEQKNKIRIASRKIPIVFSPNMCVGVNLLFKLVKEAAQKLSGDYRINIIEAHHVHKKDSPSGTAKKLAEIIEVETKRKVDDIKSIRQDEIVGDHEVVFESALDIIKLSHSAKTRDIFAEGALVAAKWIKNKKSGLFSMQDVLEVKK